MKLATILTALKSRKYIVLAAAGIALLLGGLWLYHSIYSKGEKAGSSEVIKKVQTETVKAIERARTEKEKANEAVRSKPIDAVIDGLR